MYPKMYNYLDSKDPFFLLLLLLFVLFNIYLKIVKLIVSTDKLSRNQIISRKNLALFKQDKK